MALDVDVTWLNPSSVSYDAAELRRADSFFAGTGEAFEVAGGVVAHGPTSLKVTVSAADNVTIQPGAVVIPGNAVAGGGVYRSALAAAHTEALTARDATNSRIDLVVFRALDTDAVGSHGAYTGRIQVIAGTPAATPSAPALPSMAVELARITVPASGGGTASVDASRRTYAAAVGGRIMVSSEARLPSSAMTWQKAVALDTGVEYTFNGSAWSSTGRSWTSLSSYASGYSARGAGYYTPGYRVVDGVVQLRGQISKSSALAQNDLVCTLPTAARPTAAVSVPCALSRSAGGTTGRLDIGTDGTVRVNYDTDLTDGGVRWIALDGVTFARS